MERSLVRSLVRSVSRPVASLGLVLALAACAGAQDTPPAPEGNPEADAQGLPDGVYARLDTTLGVMVLKLEHEKAPITVGNFVQLIEGTKAWFDPKAGHKVKRPFYDGLTFHRIISGFMIQGGDPNGDGSGGPGYRFKDEFDPSLRHDAAGVLSMANAGPATNGSQFFITLGPTPHLNGPNARGGGHSVFGRIVKGEEVLKKIGAVATDPSSDRPLEPVVIRKATVLRVGDAAKAWQPLDPENPNAPPRARTPRTKDVPEAQGEADPARTPKADQPLREEVKVKVICIQYAGARRAEPDVTLTQEQALAAAQRLVAHARLKGADLQALCAKWSDLAQHEFSLQRGKTEPTFEPAFRLQPGQVSDAVVTPYGVMVFAAPAQ
jgi:peptidyl-prolyl cis-trans isomerase A (cyclophilin A)